MLAVGVGVLASVLISRLGGADVKGVTSAFAASSILAFTVVNLDLAQQTLRHGRTTDTVGATRRRLLRLWPWYGALAALVIAAGLLAGNAQVAWLAAGTFAYLVSGHLALACTGLSGPVTTSVGGIIQQGCLAIGCLVAVAVGRLDTTWAPLLVIVSFLSSLPLYFWATRPREIPAPREGTPRHGLDQGRRAIGDPGVLALARAGVRWQGARLAQVLLLRMDILWVFWMLGAAPAGLYAVGLATASLAGLIPAQFASNTTYEAMQGRRASLRRNTRSAAVIGLVGALVLAAVGWPLLVLAYGRAFEPSYFVMLAALPGVVGYGVLQVYTNHMRIVAEASIVAIPSAIGAMVMLIGLVIATPLWGTTGAAIASSAGGLAAVAAAYALSVRTSDPAVDRSGAAEPEAVQPQLPVSPRS